MTLPMRKNFSLTLLFLVSLFCLSFQAFAQAPVRVEERIQQTVTPYSWINLSQWLRVSPMDSYRTEILNFSLSGQSFRGGSIEILVDGRLIGRMEFRNRNSRANFTIPPSVTLNRLQLRVQGEVYVERIGAILKDMRYVPRPIPPRR